MLKSYIYEWNKFFTQCAYLPLPFQSLDSKMRTKNMAKKADQEDNLIRMVSDREGDCWAPSLTIIPISFEW